MEFDDVKEKHRLIAYDLSEAFWTKLAQALTDGYAELLTCKDARERQELNEYYRTLSGVLQFKRVRLQLDTLKQGQTEYEVGYVE